MQAAFAPAVFRIARDYALFSADTLVVGGLMCVVYPWQDRCDAVPFGLPVVACRHCFLVTQGGVGRHYVVFDILGVFWLLLCLLSADLASALM